MAGSGFDILKKSAGAWCQFVRSGIGQVWKPKWLCDSGSCRRQDVRVAAATEGDDGGATPAERRPPNAIYFQGIVCRSAATQFETTASIDQ
jgi:hypothetical protein